MGIKGKRNCMQFGMEYKNSHLEVYIQIKDKYMKDTQSNKMLSISSVLLVYDTCIFVDISNACVVHTCIAVYECCFMAFFI